MQHALLRVLPLLLGVLSVGSSQAGAAPAGDVEIRLGKGRVHIGAVLGVGASFGKRSRDCAPPVYQPVCPPPRRIWIPAYTEVIHERVFVPGFERRVWVPARYETRIDPCGRRYTVEVCPGHWKVMCEPGRWETVAHTVHHPGRWGTRHG